MQQILEVKTKSMLGMVNVSILYLLAPISFPHLLILMLICTSKRLLLVSSITKNFISVINQFSKQIKSTLNFTILILCGKSQAHHQILPERAFTFDALYMFPSLHTSAPGFSSADNSVISSSAHCNSVFL